MLSLICRRQDLNLRPFGLEPESSALDLLMIGSLGQSLLSLEGLVLIFSRILGILLEAFYVWSGLVLLTARPRRLFRLGPTMSLKDDIGVTLKI